METDIGQVLAETALLVQKGASLPYMQADTLFELGKTTANIKDKVLLKRMTEGMGIPITTLLRARQVASRYQGDKETFLAEFRKSGAKNFSAFLNIIYPPNRKSPSVHPLTLMAVNKDLSTGIREEVQEYQKNPTKERHLLLAWIQKYVSRNIPPESGITDRSYVKYYNCTSCGCMAPEEGNHLVSMDGLFGVKIPVCDDCFRENKHPDLKRAVVMYAKYALDIERAFNRINYEED